MIPRPGVLQRVEAGIAFALLYGVGTGARALWSWLELPVAGDPIPALFSGSGVHVIVNPGGTNERFDRAHLQKATIIQWSDNTTIFDALSRAKRI
jgi:hypothetical protein